MNRIPVLHYFKDKKDLIKSYFWALIPLLLFGFYKNGILLYQNNLIDIKSVLEIGYFYLISVVVGFLGAKIMRSSPKEMVLAALIIVSTISLNTNMIIYPILLLVALIIGEYLKTKFTFNNLALAHIILILALLINGYSYLNIGEKLNKFNYDLFDVFLGFGFGGIATTSTIILIFSIIILCCNKYYKKIIMIVSSLTFAFGVALISIVTKNLDLLKILLNGTCYFSFIFMASDMYVSPSTKKGMVIYAFLIGLFSAVISIFNGYEAGFISIFIVSLFIPLIDNFTNKKYLQF